MPILLFTKYINKLDYKWFQSHTIITYLPDKVYHINGIKFGYPITKNPILVDNIHRDYPKSKSHTQFTTQEAIKGINKGYLYGPFKPNNIPFNTYHINPSYVIEQNGGSKLRHIIDCSAPHSPYKFSLNDNIDANM